MARTFHPASLRRLFRHLIAAAIAAPVPIAVMTACTSGTGQLTDFSEAGKGDSSNGPCRVAETVDAPVCGSYSLPLRGDLDSCGFGDGGVGTPDLCSKLCGRSVSSCTEEPRCTNSSCIYDVVCNSPCAVDGRRYVGLDDREAPLGDTAAAYLARMAFFEAASVDAFALLAANLRSLDAPRSLIRACNVARHDEVRHARMARTLARRHGAVVVAPRPPVQSRTSDLEAIAIENAVEGCVRETFGVVIGMWQAEAAPTAELRAFFSAITRDELRHAALSQRIDAWLCAQLSPAARHRVEAARTKAFAALEASLIEGEPPSGLGLPTNAEACALLASWRAGECASAA